VLSRRTTRSTLPCHVFVHDYDNDYDHVRAVCLLESQSRACEGVPLVMRPRERTANEGSSRAVATIELPTRLLERQLG